MLHRYSPPPCAGPPLPPVVLVSPVAIIIVFVSEEILCRDERVHWPAAGLLPGLYFAILSRVFQETLLHHVGVDCFLFSPENDETETDKDV